MTGGLIHLARSFATLLSGNLNDCQNATDPTCSAGAAAVNAYWRKLTDPKLLLPEVDLYSPFVQMHPDAWAINRIVLHDYFNYTVMTSPPPLITNQGIVDGTSSGWGGYNLLQTLEFPLLVSNIALPPSNSWQPFIETIHFDQATRLAVIAIVPPKDEGGVFLSQIPSAKGCLDYIARLNSVYDDESSQQQDQQQQRQQQQQHWIPLISYGQLSATAFSDFVEAVTTHVNPPLVVLDFEANAVEEYEVPTLVLGRSWVCSYPASGKSLHRFEIHVHDSHGIEARLNDIMVTNVTMVVDDLTAIPDKDEQYTADISYIRSLAEIAFENDPIVGYSGFMPLTRNDGNIRLCMGGECPIGNLFTDALRWYTGSDLAFITSAGVRGPGWEEGPVRVQDIWDALPFANTVCTGSILGVHLFDIFNHSTSVATYQSTFTETGDDLLQISGARYTYNTLLNTSRLIKLEVYDEATDTFQPLDRLKLYTFATDSFLCSVSRAFKDMLTIALDLKDEVPGSIDVGGLTHQLVVGEYMNSLNSSYDTTIQGRLANDTSAMDPLNFEQTEQSCRIDTGKTWDSATESCIECPSASDKVRFSEQELEFVMVLGDMQRQEQQVELINLELYPVRIVVKIVPSWMEVDTAFLSGITLESGESSLLSIYVIDLPTPEAGTSLGSVAMRVLDGGRYPGCIGGDIALDALVRVMPQEEKNQLGNLRFVGFVLSGLVLLTAVSFGLWVLKHRKQRIVKTLQPPFLIQICVGIVAIAGSLATLSIDDEIVSTSQADKACMATPWLMGLGVTFAFSALLSKLWRINKLFTAQFRRIEVREKDVLWPFLILLVLNLTFLVIWTILDPLRWVRQEINGQPWNTYGQCEGDAALSNIMAGLIVGINAIALLLACWQAFNARGISDEFSEAKYIGIAVFSWMQVLMVGFPVIFLIDKEDIKTAYFLQVAIISVICLSMLVLIFVPMMVQVRRAKKDGRASHVMVTGVAARESRTEIRARASIVGSPRNSVFQVESTFDNDQNDLCATSCSIVLESELTSLEARISHLEKKNNMLEESNSELKRHTAQLPDVESGSIAESTSFGELKQQQAQ